VPKKDPRVDAYVARSADFAKPILKFIRSAVHEGCPQAEETIKWGFPHFDYKGMLCGMAAFKSHCALGFWKNSLMLDSTNREAMGHFGRITSVEELPSRKVLVGYVKKAAELNERKVKAPKRAPKPKKAIPMPAEFKSALAKNKKASAAYDAFSPSHKREYLEWISEAKRDETREKRIATALEWIASGKPRNWKYTRR
jgi:uncharacterized protein YdeI (YjbR/CyaY-like superfamily)